jgi:DNA polymerase III gamma/tau subunit
MTIANEFRPKLFSEYIGQKGCINYLTSAIKYNQHSNGILLTGAPGVGKTSAAFLYAKATLCENRLERDYEPCNKCDSCLTKIDNMNHPNITYYRITEASTFREAVNDLITITKAKPAITHDNNRDDNNRRFIIIDEIQSASKQSISPFLDSLEFAADNVTIILISMDLNSMDMIVKDAIESRCIELTLDSLDENLISNKLTEVYNNLDKEAADLIAYLSKGNIRQAWSLLEYFITQIDVELLTTSFIAEMKLNSLSYRTFGDIVDSIENKDWDNTKSLINTYLKDSPPAVDYFLRCLLKNDLDLKGIELVSSLSFWLQSNYKIPLIAVFRSYQNHKIIKQQETISSAPKVVVQSVYSSAEQLNKTSKDIGDQLSRIMGAPVHAANIKAPAFLKLNTWQDLINNYVSSN